MDRKLHMFTKKCWSTVLRHVYLQIRDPEWTCIATPQHNCHSSHDAWITRQKAAQFPSIKCNKHRLWYISGLTMQCIKTVNISIIGLKNEILSKSHPAKHTWCFSLDNAPKIITQKDSKLKFYQNLILQSICEANICL